jgi:GNAT superfamily N-acetyltransferase
MPQTRLSPATHARVRDAWASIAGIDPFPAGVVTVFVDVASALGRPAWICILAIDEAIVAAVPRADLVSPVAAELGRVGHLRATDVVAISTLDFDDVLGPATLAYVDRESFRPVTTDVVAAFDASHPDLSDLVTSLTPEEIEESGADRVGAMAACFASFDEGRPVSVCGYSVWAGGLAHLYAFTHAERRGRGHAAAVASAAVTHALDAGLVPQWRARFEESRAVARRLGFEQIGGQVGLRPASRPQP